MVHQNVTNCAQVEINYFMQNNNASNIFHVRYSLAPGITDLDALAAVVVDWLTTVWEPIAAGEWTANNLVITDLNSATGPRKSYQIVPPISGDLSDDPTPANATIAIKEDTGIRGRGTAGRWFWVGLSEGQVDGNTVSDVALPAILIALGTLNTNIAALGAPWETMCVPHRTVNKLHPNPALTSDVIGFLATNNLIDSQKDRLPFHKKRKKKVVA